MDGRDYIYEKKKKNAMNVVYALHKQQLRDKKYVSFYKYQGGKNEWQKRKK